MCLVSVVDLCCRLGASDCPAASDCLLASAPQSADEHGSVVTYYLIRDRITARTATSIRAQTNTPACLASSNYFSIL